MYLKYTFYKMRLQFSYLEYCSELSWSRCYINIRWAQLVEKSLAFFPWHCPIIHRAQTGLAFLGVSRSSSHVDIEEFCALKNVHVSFKDTYIFIYVYVDVHMYNYYSHTHRTDQWANIGTCRNGGGHLGTVKLFI